MIREDSLISADISWDQVNGPSQCLVTWEIYGGGLMGSLLTDSESVELSLWPGTKYRVQVTCKNKVRLFILILIAKIYIKCMLFQMKSNGD